MIRVRPRGFTLVEVLLVMVVLSILAVAALPFLRGAAARADAARVRTDVRQIEFAAAQFREQRGHLPPSASWGQTPPELEPWLGEGIRFDYADLEYRLIQSSTSGTEGRLDVQIRYGSESAIGQALQRFQGEDVAWTRTRTTFFLFP